MQTRFTGDQLNDPEIAAANDILRSCVHCGFCNATCPTYLLTGDERDGPRGRIYMIRDLLQDDRAPDAAETRHLDRCLSCLSCMTTCPASVDYRHLIDPVRARIETASPPTGRRRLLRRLLGAILPRPRLAARLMAVGRWGRGAAGVLPAGFRRLVDMIPARKPAMPLEPGVHPAEGPRRFRVALLGGCIQQAIVPEINAASIRLLRRLGVEVVIAEGAGCCGSLNHHLGQEAPARRLARATIGAWIAAEQSGGAFDAVISNASGCGAVLQDYGDMFARDPDLAEPAGRIAALATDISDFLRRAGIEDRFRSPQPARIAWQAPCSLQHGQRPGAADAPAALLRRAGFEVVTPVESHICCGSAGTYNILQGALSDGLRDRKIAALTDTAPDIVATANIGCQAHLGGAIALPVVHVVQLLDWATGGPAPEGINSSAAGVNE